MTKTDVDELQYQYKNILDIRKRYSTSKDPELKRRLVFVGKKKREILEKLFNEYRSELKEMDQTDEFLHLVIDTIIVV